MFASNKEDAIDEDLDQYLDDHEESDDDDDDDDNDEDDDEDDADLDDENKDAAADDDDEPVVEHVVLSNTFEELMTRTDLDLLSYIMYDPSTSNNNKETEDSVMVDTTTPAKTINNRKYVWTSPDCCCRDVEMISNLPSKFHKYQLDMIITKKQNPTSEGEELEPRQYKIQLSGPNDISVGPTIMGLLLLLLSPKISSTTSVDTNNNNDISNITFHAFATNPRIPFPTISKQMLSSLLSLTTYQTAMTSSALTLAFVNVSDSSTIPTLLSLGHFPSVELRQCSTDNDNNNNVYSNLLYYGNDNTTFTNLIISCSQMEFTKFATQWYDYEFPPLSATTNNPTIKSPIKMLHLKLHFWLQGPSIASLCNVLKSTNISIEHLTIEYLDIIDDSWNQLFHAISFNTTIKYLKICFTDNFVDNYRRMTPERRTSRTDAVLQCVTNNNIIEEIHWPIFQQDETLMDTINTTLQSNKMNKMMIM